MKSQITQVALTGADVIALPANPYRTRLQFSLRSNSGALIVAIAFGQSATSTSSFNIGGFTSTSGQVLVHPLVYDLDTLGDQIQMPVHAATSSGTATIDIMESFL